MEINGTTYNDATPMAVVHALERAMRDGARIRVWYGEQETGEAWPEEHDVLGYVGRSTGTTKVPLLIARKGSLGGGPIMDRCIVRIDTTSGALLYRHPQFNPGKWKVQKSTAEPGYWTYQTTSKGEGVHSYHPTRDQADRYVAFMLGGRYAK